MRERRRRSCTSQGCYRWVWLPWDNFETTKISWLISNYWQSIPLPGGQHICWPYTAIWPYMASPSSNVLSHTFWCWCSTCLIISWLQISHCSWRTLWCWNGPKTRPWFLGKAGFKEDLPFIYIESYPEILIIVQVNPWHNFCPFHVLFLNLNVDSSTVILSSMPLAKVRQSYLFENHSFTLKISLVRTLQLRHWGQRSWCLSLSWSK